MVNTETNIASVIPLSLVLEHNIIPLSKEGNVLNIGLENPSNKKLLEDINFITGLKINPIKLSPKIISEKINELYGDTGTKKNGEIVVEELNQDSSTIEYVTQLINNAIRLGASDIHLEPLEDGLRIRFRMDSRLIEISNISAKKGLLVISRIKIMSDLDISEKRRPQDGKISFISENNSNIDIRVSLIPTNYGEKAVLRILDKSNVNLDLQYLGLNDAQYSLLLKKIHLPYGMILITGPTGSGKTTTLYSILKKVHSVERNILTAEDPIEYNISGINQCNVKPDIGFTFANALRSFLRQDPDIIMVGEIRDSETAEIAIKASLTGHLVLSTLHTNDSVSAITRLIDMGIEPYLVAASVKLIISQRLVRKLCSCKVPDTDPVIENMFKTSIVYTKKGCEDCYSTGYKGRTALFEFLDIDEDMEELISLKTNTHSLRTKARDKGLVSLQEAGFEKIISGITSYEEVLYETTL